MKEIFETKFLDLKSKKQTRSLLLVVAEQMLHPEQETPLGLGNLYKHRDI